MKSVSTMSSSEKIREAIALSKKYLPATMAGQIDALLSPVNIGITVGTITIWAGSHFFGVGEVVDVGLLLVGAFFVGWSIEDVAKNLILFGKTALTARSEQDLDTAARAFASAVVTGGLTAVMALLLHRSATRLQATRGSAVRDVMRPKEPGLIDVGPNPKRAPSVTGDPKLGAGRGFTTPYGDVTYSTAGSATEQQLVRVHELVHQFLSPRLNILRTFRAGLRMSAYKRTAMLQYLEEALAETVAQLSAYGIVGLLDGLSFPVANGYVTLQTLACEGAEIGTILVGTQRFSVQFIATNPTSGGPP
jgi:hypothetical protein